MRRRPKIQDRTINLPTQYAVNTLSGFTVETFPTYQDAVRYSAYVAKAFLVPTTVKAER